jgi:hypothetical protein
MKAKAPIITLLLLLTAFFAGCTTPVAIDPMTGQEQTAKYRAGYFYASMEVNSGQIFKQAISVIDQLGYFRTGELHKTSAITIYARKVGDERVTVRIKQIAPGQSEVRIRVGKFGNLAESQMVYAKIHDSLL